MPVYVWFQERRLVWYERGHSVCTKSRELHSDISTNLSTTSKVLCPNTQISIMENISNSWSSNRRIKFPVSGSDQWPYRNKLHHNYISSCLAVRRTHILSKEMYGDWIKSIGSRCSLSQTAKSEEKYLSRISDA